MYCNYCGKEIQEDANVCAYCGRRIGVAYARRTHLVRSRVNRKIAGVCAGLADYAGMDATLMRLLWAIVAVLSGIVPGIVAYLVAWIVMPEQPESAPVAVNQHVTST
ncbi:MAG TPA: PspC domain-containing protein [Terriglobales bacterium]|nr:PspC domain-containing protein [Terriglobales bacterium]